MQIHVLGSGAGGGFPQWNCNCTNCHGVRTGQIRAQARTQSSIAVSGGDGRWVLFNCSPDIRTQVLAFPELQPARGPRDTAIAGIVLIDAQIDHTTGLVSLREGDPLQVYCTEQVRSDLVGGFPLFTLLDHYAQVNWHRISLDEQTGFQVDGIETLRFHAVPLRSEAPPYSPRRGNPVAGDNIGIFVEDVRDGGRMFYAPGLAKIDESVARYMEQADCLLVDGTFWQEDEMIRSGVGSKHARDMGHLPQSGPGGMLEHLQKFPARHKVLIHINNTNPILNEDSAERAQLAALGIDVAYDGMDITL